MAHIITSPCRREKNASCVDVCPVDCIEEGEEQFYIDPGICIDCGACVLACPVNAIFYEEDVPESEKMYIEENANYFKTVLE